jgi:hypothetical protein
VPGIERSGEQALTLAGVGPGDQPLGQLSGPHSDVGLELGVFAGELHPKPSFTQPTKLSGIDSSR